jgi:hypothetical protein
MKVGIMTFHRGASPGAFLQAWFLWKALESLGGDVAFLDPPCTKLFAVRLGNILRSRRRGPKFMASELRTLLAYGLSHHRTLPKRKVRNNEFPADLDLVVIGSDEVWNVRNAYYGFMYPMMWAAKAKCRVATYAPSMGGLNSASSLPDEAWRSIATYSQVSVRDRNTLSAATERLGRSPALVCDPTLLRQAGDASHAGPVHEPFILVYTTGSITASRVADIRAHAAAHSLKIVSAGPAQPWCDENLSHLHPLAAHALFERAACVYAGTFHGMILGRKFRQPLAVEFGASKVTKSRCFLEAYCDPRCRISADDSVSRAWDSETNPALNQNALEEWIAASNRYLAGLVALS